MTCAVMSCPTHPGWPPTLRWRRGPAALTTDPTWGSPNGFLETQQRNGIVSVHPGGTTDIQRVRMARRIGIGRTAKESAGAVHKAD